MSWTIPKTWAYKEILSSADMNTYVTDNLVALNAGTNTGTAWSDFTPAIAVSGGTPPTYTLAFTSRYKQVGKTVYVNIDWRNTSGGTPGAGANQITFSAPVAAANVGTQILAGVSINAVTTEKRLNVAINSSIVFGLYEVVLNAFIGDEQNNAVRSVQLNFSYEAA